MRILKKNITRQILGICIAGAAGYIAVRLNVPLPWMIGPLVVIAAASASGFSLRLPPASRQAGQVVIGTAIGLHFTPTVALFVANFSLYIWAAAFASIALGGVLSLLFSRTGSISRTTAFFASMPGGVAEMAVLAERYGGEPGLVALAQSIRVMFIVIVVPFALIFLDVNGTDIETEVLLPLRPVGLLIMLACAVTAAFVLWKIRIVNAWLLGPLAVGILFALNEWPLSQIPQEFINAGQVLIGAALGLRFRRELILGLRRFLPAAIFNTTILVLGSAALAVVIAAWTGLQTSNMVLALAPGGVAEMSITAQVLHLGVPLVTAFHVTRMIVVILLSGPIFRGLRYLTLRRSSV